MKTKRYYKTVSVISRWGYLVFLLAWLAALAAARESRWFFPVLGLALLYVAVDETARVHAPRLRAYFNEVNHQLYGQTTASFLAQRIWDGESDLISVTFLNDKTGAPWEFSRSATTPAYFNAIVDGSECEVLVLMPPGYLIILLPPYAIREKNYFTVSGSVTLMSGVQQ